MDVPRKGEQKGTDNSLQRGDHKLVASEGSGDVAPRFYYGEHSWIGNSLTLQDEVGVATPAGRVPFSLPDGLNLTYGEITGLAGELYATDEPISDGATEEERQLRFVTAFESLANDLEHAPTEVHSLLEIFDDEVKAINAAIKDGVQPSEAYNQISSSIDRRLESATRGRPSGLPSYLNLALINFDHFGEDAEIAYNTGHSAAIKYALRADSDLSLAYAMNAFADHYLQDRFSASHLRVPRRLLHGATLNIADYCSRLMHDEDGAIGLRVSNPNGDTWDVYGDTRAFDDVSSRNREICMMAQQASADEVYRAWRDKVKPASFEAWKYAPTLDSVKKDQALAPLFIVSLDDDNKKPIVLRRTDVGDRRKYEFTPDWSYVGTAWSCRWSGQWKYPMRLDQ